MRREMGVTPGKTNPTKKKRNDSQFFYELNRLTFVESHQPIDT
jgi:hypothetical protein